MPKNAPAWPLPPLWRVIAAFVTAPAIAALGLAFQMPAYEGLPDWSDRVLRSFLIYWLIGAMPPTVVFGIPLFLILRTRVRPTMWSCGASGALVTAVPWTILTLLAMFATSEESYGPDVTIQRGQVTLLGWQYFAQGFGGVALLGFVTGAIFWAIAAAPLGRGPAAS